MYIFCLKFINFFVFFSEVIEEDCLNIKQLMVYCIFLILSVLIIFVNSVIFVVFVYGRNRLLKSFNIFVISLAFSDFLIGIIFLYSVIWNFIFLDVGYDFDLTKI